MFGPWIKTMLFRNLNYLVVEEPPLSPLEQWIKKHSATFKKLQIRPCIQRLIYDLNQQQSKLSEEAEIKCAEITELKAQFFKYRDKTIKLERELDNLKDRLKKLSDWDYCDDVIESINESPSFNTEEINKYNALINKKHIEWKNVKSMILNKREEIYQTSIANEAFKNSPEYNNAWKKKESEYKKWISDETEKCEIKCKLVFLANGYGKRGLNPFKNTKCVDWLDYDFIRSDVYYLMKKIYKSSD